MRLGEKIAQSSKIRLIVKYGIDRNLKSLDSRGSNHAVTELSRQRVRAVLLQVLLDGAGIGVNDPIF